MQIIATAAAAALLAGSASAATFTYEVDESQLFQYEDFAQTAFGQDYALSDYTITGSFDLSGDFASGFTSSVATIDIATNQGQTYTVSGGAEVFYDPEFSYIAISVVNDGPGTRYLSDVGFFGFADAARDGGAITADILTNAAGGQTYGVLASTEGFIALETYGYSSLVTVTSGLLDLPEPAPVPIPAAGGLLLAALGGIGFLRRRPA